MPTLPTLNDLEEEHWTIVVLAHRLAEVAQGLETVDDVAGLADTLYGRCDEHLWREQALIQRYGLPGHEGLAACRDYLRHLLTVMKDACLQGRQDTSDLVVAFEGALVMLLQHDRAILSQLHATAASRQAAQ